MEVDTLMHSPGLERYLPAVVEAITCALSTQRGEPDEFYASMQYAMGWTDEQLRPVEGNGGKMLRPRLCLLSCHAAGGDVARAVPAAAAIELLHNFTLVHDDIQDNSPQRRHRPSVWSLVGVPLAINTGDGMFVISHMTLSALARSGLEPALVIHALEEFALAALKVCEGQHMDISFERRDTVTSGEYLAMIERKTGALMGLSCYLGALVAGVTPDALPLYRAFGEQLGAAFQIRDDLMGVWQDQTRTGKRELEDIYSRKKSHPAVRAFETATGPDATRLRSIYAASSVSDEDALWVRDLMGRLGLHAEGKARVRDHMTRALDALNASGAAGPAADELRALAAGLRA